MEENTKIINIKGKKILFFSPSFFGYESKIKEKMKDMGAIVDYYDERSITSTIDKALLKISPQIFYRKSYRYYKNIINLNKEKDYNYIIIIKCDMTPKKILIELKRTFKNAKVCLYLWDSIKNVPNIKSKFKYFDILHSFDLEDCSNYDFLKFRPLFYIDQFKKELDVDEKYKYDISFLGTIHSDRYKVLKQVQNIADNNNLKCYWFKYLQSKFIYKFYKFTKKEFRKTKEEDFDFDKLSSEDISNIVEKTRIVLDIQHPKQTGLTMRTIEMIGMNKKIITTNSQIKQYDFYNPNNICVINRNDVNIDIEFLNKKYERIPQQIYNKYSLESWIYDILN